MAYQNRTLHVNFHSLPCGRSNLCYLKWSAGGLGDDSSVLNPHNTTAAGSGVAMVTLVFVHARTVFRTSNR